MDLTGLYLLILFIYIGWHNQYELKIFPSASNGCSGSTSLVTHYGTSDSVSSVSKGFAAVDQITWEVTEQAPECTVGGCWQIGSMSSGQYPHTNYNRRFIVCFLDHSITFRSVVCCPKWEYALPCPGNVWHNFGWKPARGCMRTPGWVPGSLLAGNTHITEHSTQPSAGTQPGLHCSHTLPHSHLHSAGQHLQKVGKSLLKAYQMLMDCDDEKKNTVKEKISGFLCV